MEGTSGVSADAGMAALEALLRLVRDAMKVQGQAVEELLETATAVTEQVLDLRV